MKVTVCFDEVRVIVPCGDGGFTVKELLDLSVTRYRKAANKSKDTYVHIHALKSSQDGGILDLDDLVSDVIDDRERLIAEYEESVRPSKVIDGADGSDVPSISLVPKTGPVENSTKPLPERKATPPYRPPAHGSKQANINLYSGKVPAPFRNTISQSPNTKVEPPSWHQPQYTEVTTGDLQKKPTLQVKKPASNSPYDAEDHPPRYVKPPHREDPLRKSKEERKHTYESRESTFNNVGQPRILSSDNQSDGEIHSKPFPQRIKHMESALGGIHTIKSALLTDQTVHDSTQRAGMEPPPPTRESRKEPLGQSGSPKESIPNPIPTARPAPPAVPPKPSPPSQPEPLVSAPEPEMIVLHNSGGPLGIHVVPYQDEITGQGGLVIHDIEPRGRVQKTGLIETNDIIIEINGRSLLSASFERAQEIFRDALLAEEIRLKVKKPPPSAQGIFSARLVTTAGSAESVPSLLSARPRLEAPYKSQGALNQSNSEPEPPPLTENLPQIRNANVREPKPLDPLPQETPQLTPPAAPLIPTRKKLYIDLVKGPEGLGFSVTSRDNNAQRKNSALIYVKNILPKGAAISNGKLSSGDQLLEVNGIPMIGKNQEEAVAVLRNMKRGSVVSLCVSRLETTFNDPNVPRQMSPSASNSLDLQKAHHSQSPDKSSHHKHDPSPSLRDKQIQILNIPLNETGSAGLGISVKGKTTTINKVQKDLGIFIKAVINGGAASKDGRLHVNDQLLAVNNIDLRSLGNAKAMETLRDAMHSEGPTPGHIKLCISRKIGSFSDEVSPTDLDSNDRDFHRSPSDHSSSGDGPPQPPKRGYRNQADDRIPLLSQGRHDRGHHPSDSETFDSSIQSKNSLHLPPSMIGPEMQSSPMIDSERSTGSSIDLLLIEQDSHNSLTHSHHNPSAAWLPTGANTNWVGVSERPIDSGSDFTTPTLMSDSFDRRSAGRQSFSEKRNGSSIRRQAAVEKSKSLRDERSNESDLSNTDESLTKTTISKSPESTPSALNTNNLSISSGQSPWKPIPAPRRSVSHQQSVEVPSSKEEPKPVNDIVKAVKNEDFTPRFYLASFLHKADLETKRKRFSDASIQYDQPSTEDEFDPTSPRVIINDSRNQRPVKLMRRSSSLETLPKKYREKMSKNREFNDSFRSALEKAQAQDSRNVGPSEKGYDPLNVSMTASIYSQPGAKTTKNHKHKKSSGFLGLFKRSKSKTALNDDSHNELVASDNSSIVNQRIKMDADPTSEFTNTEQKPPAIQNSKHKSKGSLKSQETMTSKERSKSSKTLQSNEKFSNYSQINGDVLQSSVVGDGPLERQSSRSKSSLADHKISDKQAEKLAVKERKKQEKERKEKEKSEKKQKRKSIKDKDAIEEARKNHMAEQERIAEEYKKLKDKETSLSQGHIPDYLASPPVKSNSWIRPNFDKENNVASGSELDHKAELEGKVYDGKANSDSEWRKNTVWV